MKNLVEFISESMSGAAMTLDIPMFDFESREFTDESWRTLTLPKSKYVVYSDFYRGYLPHFDIMDEMIGNFVAFQNDYEDFDPKHDILMHGDDYKELIAKALKKYENIDITQFNSLEEFKTHLAEIYTHFSGKNYERVTGKKMCDDLHTLGKFYFGEDEMEDNSIGNTNDMIKFVKNTL